MKKTNSISSFLSTKVNINIDVTANVNLGKRGGGGQYVNSETRIFVTIILRGFLPSLLLILLVLLLLNFW
ncbi:MAG: hypothetical protein LBL62_10525 [Planctomycetaceae bacterium]|jgi:hypothetical protein|nr:hypothetical protein [Planctomycetaceae bacterium]